MQLKINNETYEYGDELPESINDCKLVDFDCEDVDWLFERIDSNKETELAELFELDFFADDSAIRKAIIKLEAGYEIADSPDIQIYDNCKNYAELAELFFDEGLFGDCSSQIAPHIDFESLGRDLRHDYDISESLGIVYRAP